MLRLCRVAGSRRHVARRFVLRLSVVALAACGGGDATVVDGACAATPRYPDAIGCAYLFGRITNTLGVALDSIDGLVRLPDACTCSSPRLEGDDNGVYATVVHRLPRSGGYSDTASATVVALASAPKYPRHVTGAAFFDTARVVLRFARIGKIPPPTEVDLQIPIPFR